MDSTHWLKRLSAVTLLGLGQFVAAQTPPSVELVLDLLEAFKPGQAHDVLSCVTTFGALALAYRPGKNLKVELRPFGEGAAQVWQEPAASSPPHGTEWLALDFDFPK